MKGDAETGNLSILEDSGTDGANGAEEKEEDGEDGEDSDAPLHFNLSDPDQIRQYCKQIWLDNPLS